MKGSSPVLESAFFRYLMIDKSFYSKTSRIVASRRLLFGNKMIDQLDLLSHFNIIYAINNVVLSKRNLRIAVE